MATPYGLDLEEAYGVLAPKRRELWAQVDPGDLAGVDTPSPGAAPAAPAVATDAPAPGAGGVAPGMGVSAPTEAEATASTPAQRGQHAADAREGIAPGSGEARNEGVDWLRDALRAPSGPARMVPKERVTETTGINPLTNGQIAVANEAGMGADRAEALILQRMGPELIRGADEKLNAERQKADRLKDEADRVTLHNAQREDGLRKYVTAIDEEALDKRSGFERMFGTGGGQVLGYILATMSGLVSAKTGVDPVRMWVQHNEGERRDRFARLRQGKAETGDLFDSLDKAGMTETQKRLAALDAGYSVVAHELLKRESELRNGPMRQFFEKAGSAAGAPSADLPPVPNGDIPWNGFGDTMFDKAGQYVAPVARAAGYAAGGPVGAAVGEAAVDASGAGERAGSFVDQFLARQRGAYGPKAGAKQTAGEEIAEAVDTKKDDLSQLIADTDKSLKIASEAAQLSNVPETMNSYIATLRGARDNLMKAQEARTKAAAHAGTKQRTVEKMEGGGADKFRIANALAQYGVKEDTLGVKAGQDPKAAGGGASPRSASSALLRWSAYDSKHAPLLTKIGRATQAITNAEQNGTLPRWIAAKTPEDARAAGLMSDADVQAHQDIQAVANQVLRDETGTAQTHHEAERVLAALGSRNYDMLKHAMVGLDASLRAARAPHRAALRAVNQAMADEYEHELAGQTNIWGTPLAAQGDAAAAPAYTPRSVVK